MMPYKSSYHIKDLGEGHYAIQRYRGELFSRNVCVCFSLYDANLIHLLLNKEGSTEAKHE